MHDFGAVVYLDVPKTGSSFISRFLDAQMRMSSAGLRKHVPVMRREPATFYFISARDPLQQYLSLFRYGLGGKGSLRTSIAAAGRDDLYAAANGTEVAAFERWLDFVLSPQNAPILGEDYVQVRGDLIGFQAFRFLKLALPAPLPKLRAIGSADALDTLYRAEALPEAIVRTERLRADLATLIDRWLAPHLRQPAEARRALDSARPTNISREAPMLTRAIFSNELVARIHERERFLYRYICTERI